uniref:Uncharacterized protein n=1 Tax=Meloidogyne enterolobii TaxID=390850 RepID=A0A6V7V8Z6_MELEN|nr:unnamed protein product [Meloidogyne enterolobii]
MFSPPRERLSLIPEKVIVEANVRFLEKYSIMEPGLYSLKENCLGYKMSIKILKNVVRKKSYYELYFVLNFLGHPEK